MSFQAQFSEGKQAISRKKLFKIVHKQKYGAVEVHQLRVHFLTL